MAELVPIPLPLLPRGGSECEDAAEMVGARIAGDDPGLPRSGRHPERENQGASEQQFRGAAGRTGYGDRARLLRGEGDLPSSRALTAWRVIAVGSFAKLFSVLA